jgi:hypothetical protein
MLKVFSHNKKEKTLADPVREIMIADDGKGSEFAIGQIFEAFEHALYVQIHSRSEDLDPEQPSDLKAPEVRS